MKKKCKYIGTQPPTIPSNKFTASLFQRDDDQAYYMQVEKEEIIVGFKKVAPPAIKLSPPEDVYVTEGDALLYSYVNSKRELFYGHREGLEQQLLTIMESIKNIHARLQLANFLNLYNRSITLIQESNMEFIRKGIENLLDEQIVFERKVSYNKTKQEILESISERYEQFKKIDASIEIEDIAFIERDIAYFKEYTLRIDEIYNIESLGNEKCRKNLSRLMNKCGNAKRVDIDKISMDYADVFSFLLLSKDVVFDQDKLESFLSDEVSDTSTKEKYTSILNRGIQIDRQLGEEENEPCMSGHDPDVDAENENSLWYSFRTIKQSYLEYFK